MNLLGGCTAKQDAREGSPIQLAFTFDSKESLAPNNNNLLYFALEAVNLKAEKIPIFPSGRIQDCLSGLERAL